MAAASASCPQAEPSQASEGVEWRGGGPKKAMLGWQLTLAVVLQQLPHTHSHPNSHLVRSLRAHCRRLMLRLGEFQGQQQRKGDESQTHDRVWLSWLLSILTP